MFQQKQVLLEHEQGGVGKDVKGAVGSIQS